MADTSPTPASGDAPIDLGRVVGAVRRNGWPLAALVCLVSVIVLAISLAAPPRYEARARIAAGPGATDASTSASADTLDRELATSRELVVAPGVLTAAARSLPGETPTTLAAKVSAGVETDAGILDVNAIDNDPNRAAQIANTVGRTFLANRALTERSAAARARADLNRQLTALSSSARASAMGDALRERISDLALQEATAGSDLQLAEPATVPSAAYSPRPLRNAVLGALAALLLGVLAAVVRDRHRAGGFDAREFGTAAGLPLLALLPVGRGQRQRFAWMPAVLRRRSEVAAAERVVVEQAALLGSVRMALPPKGQPVIVVCAVGEAEGAHQVAAGLARSLSWAGQETALVRTSQWEEVDAELESARRAGHRYVILDGPAVAGSPELQLVACHASAAILVGELGRTSAAEAAAAKQVMTALDVHVLGLVLIGSPAEIHSLRTERFDAAATPPRRARRAASRNGHGGDGQGEDSAWTGAPAGPGAEARDPTRRQITS
jgi:capsular polysaccharide biosynthesis protein